jgi:hypothetical protein
MAAPSSVEISNLQVWSLYGHYYKHRRIYVAIGRAVVAGIRVMLSKAQSQAQSQMNLVVPEDDIVIAFRGWLTNDQNWTAYLAKKSHMTGPVHVLMTDTMARFIAWEAYADMIK